MRYAKLLAAGVLCAFLFPLASANAEEAKSASGGPVGQLIDQLITYDPTLALALLDATAKHPAVVSDKALGQQVAKQRAILAAVLAAKPGERPETKDGELLTCYDMGLVRCSIAGWDLIIAITIDAITGN